MRSTLHKALYLLLYTLSLHTMKKTVPLSGCYTSFSLSFFQNKLWNSAHFVCHALICFIGGVDIFGFIESNQISLVTIWGRHYFHNYLWILPVWLWDLLRQLLGLNTFWLSWFNRWAVFTFIGSKKLTEGCSDEGILYSLPKNILSPHCSISTFCFCCRCIALHQQRLYFIRLYSIMAPSWQL